MIIPDYEVGQFVRLELPYDNAPNITSWACVPESHGCWHVETTVRRIFWDGGLLLENRHGFVRVAHPDEVVADVRP